MVYHDEIACIRFSQASLYSRPNGPERCYPETIAKTSVLEGLNTCGLRASRPVPLKGRRGATRKTRRSGYANRSQARSRSTGKKVDLGSVTWAKTMFGMHEGQRQCDPEEWRKRRMGLGEELTHGSKPDRNTRVCENSQWKVRVNLRGGFSALTFGTSLELTVI